MHKQMVAVILFICTNSFSMENGAHEGRNEELTERLTDIIYSRAHDVCDCYNSQRQAAAQEIIKIGNAIGDDLLKETDDIEAIIEIVLNWGEIVEGGYRYAIVGRLLQAEVVSRVDRVKIAYALALVEPNMVYVTPLCSEIIAKIQESMEDHDSLDSSKIALVFNDQKNVPNTYINNHLRSTSNFKVVANCSKQDLSFQDLIYLGQVYLLLEADYECASDLQITAQSHDPINIKKKTSLLINAHRDLLMSKLEKLNFPESLKREHHAILARCIGNLAKPEFGDKKKLAFGLRCLELYKKGNLRVLNATANAILQTA